MLDGDAAVEVGPVLLDGALPLELAHLVQEAVASPCQSKVEIEVRLAALQVWLLDLGHHLLEGRVWPDVGKGELYAAVREVVTAYLIFVIFCTRARFLKPKFYTEKRVN